MTDIAISKQIELSYNLQNIKPVVIGLLMYVEEHACFSITKLSKDLLDTLCFIISQIMYLESLENKGTQAIFSITASCSY